LKFIKLFKKEKKNNESKNHNQQKSKLRENIEAIIVAVILAMFIRTFVIQAFKIPSGSMKPTLQVGDHILVNKFIYGIKIPFSQKTLIPISTPKFEDIIVFKYPKNLKKDYIKRVIGLPGDRVEILDQRLYINNKLIEKKKYEKHTDWHIISGDLQPRDNYGPVIVPENSLFVLGDNREKSADSRYWGFVDLKYVKGKAFIIYWSWDKENFGVRWKRITHLIK